MPLRSLRGQWRAVRNGKWQATLSCALWLWSHSVRRALSDAMLGLRWCFSVSSHTNMISLFLSLSHTHTHILSLIHTHRHMQYPFSCLLLLSLLFSLSTFLSFFLTCCLSLSLSLYIYLFLTLIQSGTHNFSLSFTLSSQLFVVFFFFCVWKPGSESLNKSCFTQVGVSKSSLNIPEGSKCRPTIPVCFWTYKMMWWTFHIAHKCIHHQVFQ